jgi:tetratricopeptide (TPR) repeat protein
LDGGAPGGVPSLAAPVAFRRAEAAVRQDRFADSADHWRSAAEADPGSELAWWGLAHTLGALGEDPSEALANAHRSGPLEPLLRVQAFLDSPVAEGHGASPLLATLARHPDALLAALAHLVRLGRWAEASRTAEEALRSAESPMVRWMLGWCLLSGSRMEAEAAAQFARAAKEPVAPPLPWRAQEREAVLGACARFPQLPGADAWAEAARRTATE